MSKLLLYVHTHRPFPFHKADWVKLVTNTWNDVPEAEKLPCKTQDLKLFGHNSLLHLVEQDAEYVGITGYRRYPLVANHTRCAAPRLYMEPNPETMAFLAGDLQRSTALDILKSHDVIQFRGYPLEVNVREQFALYKPQAVWDIMVEEFSMLGLGSSLGYLEYNNHHVWTGFFITTRQVAADLAGFGLNLIRKLEARDDFRKIADSQKFTSPNKTSVHPLHEWPLEVVIPLWFFHHRLRSAYVPMVCLEKTA